jgi:outer membrane protein insertion porin family
LVQLRHNFRGLCAALIAASAWLCATSFASGAESVLVQGNKRVDSASIASYFKGTSEAEINKAVKDLYATGLFSSIKISHAHGRTVVTVAENIVIRRVVFEGNNKIKSETLASIVQSKSGGPYSPAIVASDVERIKDIYRRAGYAAATVTACIVDPSTGRVAGSCENIRMPQNFASEGGQRRGNGGKGRKP